MDEPALAKLVSLFGPERARGVYRETLERLGMTSLDTPDDRLRFGESLIARGGLLTVVGRSIKIQAILQGARG